MVIRQALQLCQRSYAETDAETATALEAIVREPIELARMTTTRQNAALLVVTSHRVLIAVRGTDKNDSQSIRQNLQIKLDVVGVHEGYAEAVEELDNVWVTAGLAEKPIHLTGHSAGGAIAEAAAITRLPLHMLASITTAGSPRLTRKGTQYAEARDVLLRTCRYTRLVASGDPIPVVPPARWGWRHAVPATFITSGHRIIKNASRPRMAYEWFKGVLARDQKPAGASHSLQNYLESFDA